MTVAIAIIKQQIPLVEAVAGTKIVTSTLTDVITVFYGVGAIHLYGPTWDVDLPLRIVNGLHVSE